MSLVIFIKIKSNYFSTIYIAGFFIALIEIGNNY